MAPADLPDPASPAEVAGATFPTKRRGFDQRAVGAFLHVVAEELTRRRMIENQLRAELGAAQERARSLAALDEATVAEVVGEESTRVLVTAREAARQIRERAEQAATNLLATATEQAERIRHEAEIEVARRREETAALVEAEIEAAKDQGRSMVQESRDYRERVLADLSRRRDQARVQIEHLEQRREQVAAAFEAARRAAEEVMAGLGVDPASLDAALGTGPLDETSPLSPIPNDDLAAAASSAESEGGDVLGSSDASLATPETASQAESESEPEVSPVFVDREAMFADDDEMSEPTPKSVSDQDSPNPFAHGDAEAGTTLEAALGSDPFAAETVAVDDDLEAISDGEVEFVEDFGDVESITTRSSFYDEPATEPVVHHPVLDDDLPAAPVISLFRSGSARDLPVEQASPEDRKELEDECLAGEGVEPESVADDYEIETDVASWGEDADETEPIETRTTGPDAPDESPEVSSETDVSPNDDTLGSKPLVASSSVPTGADFAPRQGGADPDPKQLAPRRSGGSTRVAEVEDVFARLRAASTAEVAREVTAGVPSPAPVGGAESASGSEEIAGNEESRSDSPGTAEGFPADRHQELAPIAVAIARRLKRVLADEQNLVLDAVRRSATDLAVTLERGATDHLERSYEVILPDLVAAARSGAQWAGVGDHEVDLESLAPVRQWLREEIVDPLRSRLSDAFEAADRDPEGFSTRSRHVFREWKSQRIDEHVEDLVRLAHALGVLGSVAPGTPMCWLVDPEGPPCADAEDNALAGVVAAGEAFPTGHRHPPAHTGCRCLVAPIAG